MHVGSNPTARTSQSQSFRSPYRGAGRLFCTRFASLMASCWCPMICCSPLSMPFCLFNRVIAICGSILPILPAARTVFPRRRIVGLYSIRRVMSLFNLTGRDAAAFLTASFPFRWCGEGSAPASLPVFYPSNRLLASLFASLSAGRLGVSPTIRFPIRPAG